MPERRSKVRFEWRAPQHWLAFGLGAGLLPYAPGTWGTLVAVPIYLLLSPLTTPVYLSVVALLFGLGVWACGTVGRDLGVHDHSAIVWDEVVGYLVAVTGIPADWRWMVAGFVLFRLFDILKPWPIRVIDRRLKGGLGVMLDDVAAGVATLVLLHGAMALWA
jgi:phosphatidylglycerophosphatase A